MPRISASEYGALPLRVHTLLAGVPLLGLVVAPAAAVGGTLLFLELEGASRPGRS